MKLLSGIIAFTLTFGMSVALIGLIFGFPEAPVRSVSAYHTHSTAHTAKIRRFLSRDIRNGDIRDEARNNHFQSGKNSYSYLHADSEYQEAVNTYYRKSAAMDDTHMPADFRYAWRKHMEAWGKQAKYLKEINSSDTSADIDAAYSDNTGEINETWYQVLRIAYRYGVDTDSPFYYQ